MRESCSSDSGAFVFICTEDGGMAFVRNGGRHLPDVTATLMQYFLAHFEIKPELNY
jgi:hypothetical protein